MKRLALLAALCCIFIAGCNNVPRAYAPDKCHVFQRYDHILLNKDTSSNVLNTIQCEKLCEEEYLSQSESVVAKWGQRGDYAATWFNMVAFDEDSLTVSRKYALLVDEDSPQWGVLLCQPSKKLRLDMEVIMDSGVLEEPYADENAKRIAVIKEAKKLYMNDAVDIREDSHAFDSISMLVNTTFNQILEQLDRSPAKAVRLTECRGMDFDHATLNEGKIRIMFCDKDIVKIKIKVGQYTKDFEDHDDVKNMSCDPLPCYCSCDKCKSRCSSKCSQKCTEKCSKCSKCSGNCSQACTQKCTAQNGGVCSDKCRMQTVGKCESVKQSVTKKAVKYEPKKVDTNKAVKSVTKDEVMKSQVAADSKDASTAKAASSIKKAAQAKECTDCPAYQPSLKHPAHR